MTNDTQLARTFAELADNLVDDFDVVDLLTILAERCVEVLDVAAAGIMLAGTDGVLRVVASTSDEMQLLELLEEHAEEGPCPDTYRTRGPVLNQQLATAGDRWPQFAPAALAAGFQVVQALPLMARETIIGALNLFHVHPTGMSAEDTVIAQAFADVATIAVLQHRLINEAELLRHQLSEVLNSRITIEQAKGMIAQVEGLDMAKAFNRLREHARNHNLRLVDLAADVVSGRIAASALDPRADKPESGGGAEEAE